MSLSWSAWEKGHHWEVGLWVLFCIFHLPFYIFLAFLFVLVFFFKLEKKQKLHYGAPVCVPGASLATETLLVLSGS